MKKAILLLFLSVGISLQAQEFDFECEPLTSTVSVELSVGLGYVTEDIDINSNQSVYTYQYPIIYSTYVANGAYNLAGDVPYSVSTWEQDSTFLVNVQGVCGEGFVTVTLTVKDTYDYTQTSSIKKYAGNVINSASKVDCG